MLRIFHLVGSGRRLLFLPFGLLCRWCGRGALPLQKEPRGTWFLSYCSCVKRLLPLAFSPAAIFSTFAAQTPYFTRSHGRRRCVAALQCHQVRTGGAREGRDPPPPQGRRAARVDRSLGERQGAKPAPGLCGLLSVVPRPGFGTPAGRLIRAILHYYEVELHNLNPNSVMQAAVFATVCEGFLGVPRHWNLWLHLFKAEKSARYVGGRSSPCESVVARCSSASSGLPSTSGVRCPHQTWGGRTDGSTSRMMVGCSRRTLGRW